jgi:hypothetical protein
VSAPPLERVIAALATDAVAAVTAADLIVAAQADDDVRVRCPGEECIGSRGADDGG